MRLPRAIAALALVFLPIAQNPAYALTQNSGAITDFGFIATFPLWQQAYGNSPPSVLSAAHYYDHWVAKSGSDPNWQDSAPSAPWMDPIDYTVSFSNVNPAPGTPTYLNVGVIRLTVPATPGVHFVGLGHYSGNTRAPFVVEFFRSSGTKIAVSDLTAPAVSSFSPAIFTPADFSFNYVDGQRFQHFPAPVNYGIGWWAIPKLEDIVLRIPNDFVGGETIGLRVVASATNSGELGLMLAPYVVTVSGNNLPSQALLADIVPQAPDDTDLDGVNDYREGKDGTNPNDATSFNPLSKGLVVYYPFDGGADDESGNGNDLTLLGSFLGVDRFAFSNSSLAVARETGAVSAKNVGISGNSDRTISFWLKPTTNPLWPDGNDIIAWGKAGWSSGKGRICAVNYVPYSIETLGINLSLAGFYADSWVLAKPTNFAGRWQNVVVVYTGSQLATKYYVDGVRQTNNFQLSSDPHNIAELDTIDTPLILNAGTNFNDNGSGNRGIAGFLDDVRVYDRCLSEAEIEQIYVTEVGNLDSDDDGLTDAAEYLLEGLGFDPSVNNAAQVLSLFNDPNNAALFTIAQYNANRTNGQVDVTTNPSAFKLFTQQQHDANRTNGQADVTKDPAAYGLFTQVQYDAFGALQFSNGQTSVTTNPSAFSLFTQQQHDANRTNGRADVIGDPGAYGLFTQSERDAFGALQFSNGVRSLVDAMPSVELSAPASTIVRVGLGPNNVTGVTVSNLPPGWAFDAVSGQIHGRLSGTNPVSAMLLGQHSSGASVPMSFTFTPQPGQTIAPFATMPVQRYANPQPTLTIVPPTASSGLPVTVTVKSGPATISNNVVTLTGAGRVELAANQSGTPTMAAAPEVTTFFNVAKGSQSISFGPLATEAFAPGKQIQLSATSSSGLPMTYTTRSASVISISNSTVTIIGRGRATIQATQPGNNNWNPSKAVNQTLVVF